MVPSLRPVRLKDCVASVNHDWLAAVLDRKLYREWQTISNLADGGPVRPLSSPCERDASNSQLLPAFGMLWRSPTLESRLRPLIGVQSSHKD